MKGEAAIKRLGLLAGALVLLTACGGGSTASTVNAATAKSAADVGGISALVTAAKKEGKLNIIATPPDWANYGAIIDGFKAKYGISIDSANPNGSSQDEINAVKQLGKTSRAPDVLDMGKAVNSSTHLKLKGNFPPVQETRATVKQGQTPVVFDWDYLSA